MSGPEIWQMYFECAGVKFDAELTANTLMSELIDAMDEHGLLDKGKIKEYVLIVNKENGKKLSYYPGRDQQKTIMEMGMEPGAHYSIVPDGVVA